MAPSTVAKVPRAKSGAPGDLPLTGTFGDEGDAPTPAQIAAMKRGARVSDQAYADAYKAGQQDAPEGPGGRSGGGSGSPRSGTAKSVSPANLLRAKPVVAGGSPAQEGAGILLGLFAYALVFAYLEGGPAGVTSWLRAKFLNEGGPAAPASSTPAATPARPAMPDPRSLPTPVVAR